MSLKDEATVQDVAAPKWESQDLYPIGLSKAHRSFHGECGPSFGVSILLRYLCTTQAHLTPSLVTENNTTFCPVTAHWSSPLLNGETEIWDSSQSYAQTSFIYVFEAVFP